MHHKQICRKNPYFLKNNLQSNDYFAQRTKFVRHGAKYVPALPKKTLFLIKKQRMM
jgi:hypothetical protein